MKSFYSTPFALRYLPAGLLAEIFPAGLIWSVVIESPNNAKQNEFTTGFIVGNSKLNP